jgi:hypothetical protein|tara:strand:+ start:124 stop:486 length:363 start_codon:yes stop_codon:yes gene_type:complete
MIRYQLLRVKGDKIETNDFWADEIEKKREQRISAAFRNATASAFEADAELAVRWEEADRERKTSRLGRRFGHRDWANALRAGWELDDALDRHLYGCPQEFLYGDERATDFYIRRFHDNKR